MGEKEFALCDLFQSRADVAVGEGRAALAPFSCRSWTPFVLTPVPCFSKLTFCFYLQVVNKKAAILPVCQHALNCDNPIAVLFSKLFLACSVKLRNPASAHLFNFACLGYNNTAKLCGFFPKVCA